MAEKYQAKLENGEVITLEKECDCIIHDEPCWIHRDRLQKELNMPLLRRILSGDALAVQPLAINENARLKEKIKQMGSRKIIEIIVPEKIMIQDKKIKAYEDLIIHLIRQMRSNPNLRQEIGFGTQTFELLTEAGSLAFNESVEQVAEYCLPKEQLLENATQTSNGANYV